MSRVLFVTLGESDVLARCAKEGIGISAIESLPAGGTRLVCMSAHGAATMQRKFKPHLINGPVDREKFRPTRPLW